VLILLGWVEPPSMTADATLADAAGIWRRRAE
jgi:hypothetical protein